MNELLGSRIKALRSANNFTQEQVADQIGISRQKYARIESGTNSVTLDILSKVAEVLGVTVGDITRVLDETPVVQYRAGEAPLILSCVRQKRSPTRQPIIDWNIKMSRMMPNSSSSLKSALYTRSLSSNVR